MQLSCYLVAREGRMKTTKIRSNKVLVSVVMTVFFLVCHLSGQLSEDERNTIDIVNATKNSVVFVTNIQLVQDRFRFEQEVPGEAGLLLFGITKVTS